MRGAHSMDAMPTEERADSALRYLPHLLFIAWCVAGILARPALTGAYLLYFAILLFVPACVWLILVDRRPDLFPNPYPKQPISVTRRWRVVRGLLMLPFYVGLWWLSRQPLPVDPLQLSCAVGGLIASAYVVVKVAIRRRHHGSAALAGP